MERQFGIIEGVSDDECSTISASLESLDSSDEGEERLIDAYVSCNVKYLKKALLELDSKLEAMTLAQRLQASKLKRKRAVICQRIKEIESLSLTMTAIGKPEKKKEVEAREMSCKPMGHK